MRITLIHQDKRVPITEFDSTVRIKHQEDGTIVILLPDETGIPFILKKGDSLLIQGAVHAIGYQEDNWKAPIFSV